MKLVSKLFLLMLLCIPSFCLASSDKNITKLPTCSEVTVTKSVINIANNTLYKELLPSNLDGYSEKILNEAKLIYNPTQEVTLNDTDNELYTALFDILEDLDDVSEIFDNVSNNV